MTNKYLNDYKKFLDAWGEESQERMLIEEMSELTKALCKQIRLLKDDFGEKAPQEKIDKNIENLKEEIADVLNMTEQVEMFYGIDEIEKIREEKMLRTLDLLK